MAPLPGRDQLLKEVIIRAVASPASLLAGATGLLLLPGPAWPGGLCLLVIDAAYVWARIRDPAHAEASSEAMIGRRWRNLIQRLEELSTALDPETSAALSGIVEA